MWVFVCDDSYKNNHFISSSSLGNETLDCQVIMDRKLDLKFLDVWSSIDRVASRGIEVH